MSFVYIFLLSFSKMPKVFWACTGRAVPLPLQAAVRDQCRALGLSYGSIYWISAVEARRLNVDIRVGERPLRVWVHYLDCLRPSFHELYNIEQCHKSDKLAALAMEATRQSSHSPRAFRHFVWHILHYFLFCEIFYIILLILNFSNIWHRFWKTAIKLYGKTKHRK